MPTFTQPRKYQTDAGTIVRIRISDQGLAALANAEPAGAVTDSKIFAFARNPGSRRKKELNARGVVLGRLVGVAPNQFTRRTFLPILTPARLTAIALDATVTLNGQEYTVRDKIDEA